VIGVVIVNYNDSKTTINLLNNIKVYKSLKEIVVVDNKSTDNSLNELKNIKSKRITILESKENKGYNGGLNIGCKYLIDKYKEINIIISNSDIIIDSENDLVELCSYLNNDIVVVGPTILQGNDLNRGFRIPTPMQDVKQNIVYFGKKVLTNELSYPDNYYYKNLSKVEAVSGCIFAITSKHLKDIGYFDEGVFLYYEENILGVETKRLNKKIVVCNNIDVIHNHSVSIDKSVKRIKKYDILKTSQAYFEKKYNNCNWFTYLLMQITRYISMVILFIKYLIF